jgi:hypothetical protein
MLIVGLHFYVNDVEMFYPYNEPSNLFSKSEVGSQKSEVSEIHEEQ